ncbi:MAG: hypothetical protein LC541_18310 [Candidatus Thiodiazotropha sp.]|nr:hypothetical protein [Candidatus Thiodiazotropha sp.]MCM8885224.1 hypothetical protein [Candidatus Thiodiazotropha sp.]MCM8921012.1 hypothetical protein [Candidatus Thiodiazotropha sp.]MCU7874600.1 hypothetical protein [Candidatus Thiodiazotropha sp. (ex Lucinoma borealis)]MCU7883903.1 hypothetical protein [Candidatus Thiodiazotropha sp. (ex Lucinoma annulata)]
MEQKTKKVKKRAGKVIHSAVSKHAIEKAKEIRSRYGPDIDYPTLLQLFEDRRCIRHPVEIRFVSDGIEPGLFGKTELVSDNPDDGYVISLHQQFESQPEVLPALILYQSVLVNYGDLATADDAELFASTVLDLDREIYYTQIVTLTDALWSD